MREVIEDLDAPDGINIHIEGVLPTLVFNPVQFRQVVQNLVGNAVKHMGKPEGEVVVSCEDAEVWWSFSVRDTGPGIPREHFDRIFRVFQTLRSRDEEESTGIGLSIVKKIVERAGGTVSVQSTVGAGTTFTFTIRKGNRP